MAFTLSRRRGPISKQLRRLIRKQLSSALDELSQPAPDQGAIHEARKSIKRVRAVLRVVKNPLGAACRVEDQRLRWAARGLSSLRDAALRGTMLNGPERLADVRASQVSLRRRALGLGHRIFNQAPKHF